MHLAAIILVSLYLIVPGIAAARLISPERFFSSCCLRIAVPFIVGLVSSTVVIALVATAITFLTQGVLYKASLIVLGTTTLIALPALRKCTTPPRYVCFILLALGVISYFIFSVHLTLDETKVFASPVYWDFPCHLTSIHGFVHGDNFPPQMEVYAGVFQTYHFLANMPMAICVALGLHPVEAINWYSTIAFSVLLLTLIGICEELFESTTAGLLAVGLTLTSSSLRFIDYLRAQQWSEPLRVINQILINQEDPYSFSFEPSSAFGYQGVMFNLFYFIEERQLIIPATLFMLTPLVIRNLSQISLRCCLILGAALGLFLVWHAFIMAAVCASLLFCIPLTQEKRKTAAILLTATIVAAPIAWLMNNTMALPEFQNLKEQAPRVNFTFIEDARLDFFFSIPHLIGFYLYAYGIKIPAAIGGALLLRSQSRAAAHALVTTAITTLVLTNTLQLAPNGISENHKWLRSISLLLDVLSAGGLIYLLRRKTLVSALSCLLLVPLLTISGILEGIPFLRSRPSQPWLEYPSAFDAAIYTNSAPHDVFATWEAQRVVFSGRRVYVAPTSAWSGTPFAYHTILDESERLRNVEDLFFESDRTGICRKAHELGIDVVQISAEIAEQLQGQVPHDAIFVAPLEEQSPPTFFHTRRGCNDRALP